MTTREDALKEPGRPESQVFALIYVGDQLGALLRKLDEQTPKHVQQPAKAAQNENEPPRPMGASGASGKKKPVAAAPESPEHDSNRDQ